jgi:hypothetical protein
MTVKGAACRTLPTADTRQRIVDVAAQEWAFFGFPIVAPDTDEDDSGSGNSRNNRDNNRGFRRQIRAEEGARVAASIAGYWAVTTAGAGIVSDQNKAWNGTAGTGARWIAPWSAAFISWVMCEGGLGNAGQFQRAIAHHTYIDQGIRARDGNAPQAAYAAYDAGEAAIEPGDLLCTSRRPVYRNLAERRGQMGEGARTHCDVVVKIDETNDRIFTIGGNVGGAVSMKLLPASREQGKHFRPVQQSMLGRVRPIFAHLKLRAKSAPANALDYSPTMKALTCARNFPQAARISALSSAPVSSTLC